MTWDEFCDELAKDLELARKWITYETYTDKDGFSIVRFDLFKDKPFHFTVGIENSKEICNGSKASSLANALRFSIKEALETKQPPKMRGFCF
jgi:hypothetical protein